MLPKRWRQAPVVAVLYHPPPPGHPLALACGISHFFDLVCRFVVPSVLPAILYRAMGEVLFDCFSSPEHAALSSQLSESIQVAHSTPKQGGGRVLQLLVFGATYKSLLDDCLFLLWLMFS